MYSIGKHFFGALAVSLLSVAANATIIEGSFKARVSEIYEYESGDAKAPFGDVALGQQISGNFWYDTALIRGGANDPNEPNVAYYTGSGNWLNVTYQIGEHTFDANQHPDAFTKTEDIQDISIQKYDPDYWWDIRNMFSIYQYNTYRNQSTSENLTTSSRIMLLAGLEDTLNYVSLMQDFSLVAQNEWDYWGYVSADISTISNNEIHSAVVSADIFEFTIGPRQQTNVLEPSVLYLFALSLLTLYLRRRFRIIYIEPFPHPAQVTANTGSQLPVFW